MTDEEKAKIIARSQELIRAGVPDDFAGLSDDDAMAVILPSVGFDEAQARFILAQARGELPDHYIDADGTEVWPVYDD